MEKEIKKKTIGEISNLLKKSIAVEGFDETIR